MAKMTKAERLELELRRARMHADSGEFPQARLKYESIIKEFVPKTRVKS